MLYYYTRGVFLYSREINPAPESPLVNGRPLFGSFSGPFEKFDIRGLKRAFGNYPIPVLLTNLRIFESIRFLFCDENCIGEIELFNAHYFAYMETVIWNRETKHKIAYRHIVFPGFIRIPRSFANSVSACRSRSRFVRIHTRLQRKLIHADFDFLGSDYRPPCEGRIEMDLSAPDAADFSSVVPYKVKRKCQVSYQVSAPLHGWINTGFEDHQIQANLGIGFLDVRKTYMSLRTKGSSVIGLGKINGQTVTFRFGNSVFRDDGIYNDNVLFWGGKPWPMPAVKITRPYGIMGDWVIQDTESMVDLVFTPVSDNARKLSAFIVRTEYHSVYGLFNGVLITSDGIKIGLKEFPGVGKKILLRV